MVGTPFEVDTLSGQLDEVVCAMCEVLDPDSKDADRAKKCANFGEVFARAPVANDCDAIFFGDATLVSAAITKNREFSSDKNRLLA